MNKRKQSLILALIIAFQIVFSGISGVSFAASDSGVIDNSDGKHTTTGEWTNETAADCYGDNYSRSNNGTVTIKPAVSKTGNYKIYLRWPKLGDVTENLEITVKDGEGEEFKVLRDQTINGGYWVLVGTYYFKSGDLQTITMKAQDSRPIVFDAMMIDLSAETTAKAPKTMYEGLSAQSSGNTPQQGDKKDFDMRKSAKNMYSSLPRITSLKNEAAKATDAPVEKPVEVGDEFVYDTSSPEFSTSGGSWVTEQSEEALGGKYMSDGDIGDAYLQIATWAPNVKVHGHYEVYIRWPGGNDRPDSAKVIVENFEKKDSSHVVDQTKNSGQWNLIGEYEFKKGVNKIILQANARGYTAADAVKIKLVSTDNLTPEKQYGELKNYRSDKPYRYNIVMDENKHFYLTRNGEKLDIHGACYDYRSKLEDILPVFKEAGGNMIRIYGSDALYQGVLDLCYELGITCMVQIWVERTDSMNYNDPNRYLEHLTYWKKVIDDFKDHPAIAMWCVNNEAEVSDQGGEVYTMTEELARYIKKVDPYHPVATMFAGCGQNPQTNLMTMMPSIDILGVNVYKAVDEVYASTVKSGWNGPVVVGEFGPDGTWEVDRTEWGAIIEQPNGEKGDLYRTRYLTDILGNTKGIGGFAFCMANAVGAEGTETWYAFLIDGMETPVMHEMRYAWTGKYSANVAPRINKFKVNGKEPEDSVVVAPGEEMTISLSASDKENDTLSYNVDVKEEIKLTVTAKEPLTLSSAKDTSNPDSIKVKAPDVPGWYRIYAKVTDGHNNVCMDNFPIYVKQTSGKPSADINNPELIKTVLTKASDEFVNNGFMKSNVGVQVNEIVNGMVYDSTGSAVVEADGRINHISSEVNYTSSEGKQTAEVYFDKTKARIKADNGQWTDGEIGEYYDLLGAYKDIILNDKAVKDMTIDNTSDDKYIIIKSKSFVPNFYHEALMAFDSASFHKYSELTDKHSLTIYVSKENGRVVKTLAEFGYTVSKEEARYRTVKYTYEYVYGDKTEIKMP